MTEFVESAVDFAKDKIDKGMEIWDGFDDDKKKLLIGCAIAAVSIICVASIAYAIGRAQGRRLTPADDEI